MNKHNRSLVDVLTEVPCLYAVARNNTSCTEEQRLYNTPNVVVPCSRCEALSLAKQQAAKLNRYEGAMRLALAGDVSLLREIQRAALADQPTDAPTCDGSGMIPDYQGWAGMGRGGNEPIKCQGCSACKPEGVTHD